MIRSFANKQLEALYNNGDCSRLPQDSIQRLVLMLEALSIAENPSDMNFMGCDFIRHGGDKLGLYSVRLCGTRRITFRWIDGGAAMVDLQD